MQEKWPSSNTRQSRKTLTVTTLVSNHVARTNTETSNQPLCHSRLVFLVCLSAKHSIFFFFFYQVMARTGQNHYSHRTMSFCVVTAAELQSLNGKGAIWSASHFVGLWLAIMSLHLWCSTCWLRVWYVQTAPCGNRQIQDYYSRTSVVKVHKLILHIIVLQLESL